MEKRPTPLDWNADCDQGFGVMGNILGNKLDYYGKL